MKYNIHDVIYLSLCLILRDRGSRSMEKEYVVIGLGRFGGSIVRELNALDMDVMAIDRDEARVNEYSDIATRIVVADTTDEAVMKSLGIRNFDHVIVAIGENIQSSTLTTLILKELGVKKLQQKLKMIIMLKY